MMDLRGIAMHWYGSATALHNRAPSEIALQRGVLAELLPKGDELNHVFVCSMCQRKFD
jgi:hypothetical protein